VDTRHWRLPLNRRRIISKWKCKDTCLESYKSCACSHGRCCEVSYRTWSSLWGLGANSQHTVCYHWTIDPQVFQQKELTHFGRGSVSLFIVLFASKLYSIQFASLANSQPKERRMCISNRSAFLETQFGEGHFLNALSTWEESDASWTAHSDKMHSQTLDEQTIP